MRFRVLTVMLSLSFPATAVFAQEGTNPEAGELAAPAGETGGGVASAGETGGSQAAPDPVSDNNGPKKPISVGLLLGYGLNLDSGGNPWGFGFGVRGGYNFHKIFVGGRFVYYVGENSVNVWELGAEGGYDIDAGPVVIRPGIGIGIANMSVSIPSFSVGGVTVGGGSASSTDLYLAPGVGVLGDVTDNIFIGGEARLQLILASNTVKALILLANAGMRF